MKKILTSSVLIALAAMPAWCGFSSPNNAGTSFALTSDNKPEVTIKIVAPTTYDWNQNYAEIPADTKMTLVVNRSCYNIEDEHQVGTIENVAPGDTVIWKDPDTSAIKFGESYNYKVKATAGEDESSWGYFSCYVGIKPNSPVVTASSNLGQLPVTVTFTVPTTNDQNEPLSVPITKIVLTRAEGWGDKSELKTFENLVAGDTITYIDNTAELQKTYNYYAMAYCDYGYSFEGSAKVLVDMDQPDQVSDIKVQNNGTEAVVSWKAPAKGINSGYLDPASVKYDIYRYYGYNDRLLLAENLSETEYTDTLKDFTKEIQLQYQVISKNDKGTGTDFSGISDKFVVGPMSSLPYSENFNAEGLYGSKVAQNIWEASSSETYGNATVDYSTYYNNWQTYAGGADKTESAEDGFFMFKYAETSSTPNRHDYYATRPLNVAGVSNVVLSLQYLCMPTTKCGLSVEYLPKDSTNFIVADTIPLSKGEDNKWEKVFVNLGNLGGGDTAVIRLHGWTGSNPEDNKYFFPVCVDNVVIDNFPTVTDAKYEILADGKAKITWNAPVSDSQTAVGYDVMLGSEVVAELEDNELSYTTPDIIRAGQVYAYGVRAVYRNVQSPEAPVEIKLMEFVDNGIKYGVNENDITKVAVIGYPSDNVNAVIPAEASYAGDEFVVNEIGDEAFYNMPDLASIKFNETIERIGDRAFWTCTGLKTVEIPASVKEIGEGAFLYCQNLTSATLPEGLEKLGISTFQHTALKSVALPKTLRVVPNYAFSTCIFLESVTIPEGVEEIGFSAFEDNTTLAEVEFPASLCSIANLAFNSCSALAKATFKTTVPPQVGDNSFNEVAKDAKGVCPKEAIDAYSAVEGLKPFDFKDYSGIDEIDADAVEVEYFDLNGLCVAQPAEGIVTVAKVTSADGSVKFIKIAK